MTSKKEHEGILECPFCGGESEVFCHYDQLKVDIVCSKCRVRMSNMYVHDLKTSWNTRVESRPSQKVQLEEETMIEPYSYGLRHWFGISERDIKNHLWEIWEQIHCEFYFYGDIK